MSLPTHELSRDPAPQGPVVPPPETYEVMTPQGRWMRLTRGETLPNGPEDKAMLALAIVVGTGFWLAVAVILWRLATWRYRIG